LEFSPKHRAECMAKRSKIPHLFMVALLGCGFMAPWVNAGHGVTPASAIHVPDGFRVERLHSGPSGVALCFDDAGNLYMSQQVGPRIYRLAPPPIGAPVEDACAMEEIGHVGLNGVQGIMVHDGWLYLVRRGSRIKRWYQVDDVTRVPIQADGTLGTPETIFEFRGVPDENEGWDVEHGVHAIVLAPDKASFYLVGGDTMRLPTDALRTPPHWNRDRWGETFQDEPYPGGWVMRADLDGSNAEVICVGLRNSYDIAFNQHGDLFTFDSDLEHTMGLPDYRPTAIRQILSGTESGWGSRAGAMRWSWPATWEDIQPPIKNIGPGSPTGVCFGYGAKVPEKYQSTFFACDWSYGRVFAVDLRAQSAGYEANVETFLSASGLPIADIAVSPKDGAIYFVTGGRGVGGGLYRIIYEGDSSTDPVAPAPLPKNSAELRDLRLKLEHFHGAPRPDALDFLWPYLGHDAHAIRAAARIALEWQDIDEWKARALAESNPRIALQALMALVRSTDGQPEVQAVVLAALAALDLAKLGNEEQAWYLRVLTISAIRHGMYPEQEREKLCARLEALVPTQDRHLNEALVSACVALGTSTLQPAILDLLERSTIQEEQVHYTQALLKMQAASTWTPALRERFFDLASRIVPHWKGGAHVKPLREKALQSVVDMLTPKQREAFADRIAAAKKPASMVPSSPRSFVKAWTMDDFTPSMEAGLKAPRDLRNGKALYAATGCIACHNFRGEGGLAGPDLSAAGGRFSPRDLMDNILNPNKVINDQYALKVFTRTDDSQVVGRLVNLAIDKVMVATNPLDPGGSEVLIHPDQLKSVSPWPMSFMPSGLLDTLTEAGVLDLLAYMSQPIADPFLAEAVARVPSVPPRPAKIFSDHMVLQCDLPVPVWGWAEAGATVVVEFDDQVAETRVDSNGQWRVNLKPMAANATGRDMVIRCGNARRVLQDILVGEVWFTGGQSNMDYRAGAMADRLPEGRALVDAADLNGVRLRIVRERHRSQPRADLSGGQWQVCSPETARHYSAVAFVFANRLHRELNVPVGMIDCSWGGTPIEPYVPASAFVGHPTLVTLRELGAVGDLEAIKALKGGTFARNDGWLVGMIYNTGIAPVAPYAMRGALWYQGESNAGKGQDPRDYAYKLKALISGWRQAWDQPTLPVYVVQLPQWSTYAWTYLREEQRRVLDVKHTGLAVTVDLDNANDIHPPNKIDVGERLALWPLAQQYGRKITFSGPLYRSAKVKRGVFTITFDHVKGGLMVGRVDGVGKIVEVPDGVLNGFELVGEDGVWYAADAAIKRGRVVVRHATTKKPRAVRYACYPQAPDDKPWNLYNKAGLPASPFCSDWEQMPYDPQRD
jgi:putative heme-binding domain-containing protein